MICSLAFGTLPGQTWGVKLEARGARKSSIRVVEHAQPNHIKFYSHTSGGRSPIVSIGLWKHPEDVDAVRKREKKSVVKPPPARVTSSTIKYL